MLILDIDESFGAQTVLKFNTSIVRTSAQVEQRIVNWDRGLLKFDFTAAIVSQSQLIQLQEFHAAVKGSATTFLFKDWMDCGANHYLDGGGEKYNSHTRGVLLPLGNNTFKAYKRYAIAGAFVYRPIVHLDPNSFVAYEYLSNSNNTRSLISSIDLDGTIEIQPTIPFAPNSDFYWSGDFFVPVRFDIDELEYQIEGNSEDGELLYSVPRLILSEVAEDIPAYSYVHNPKVSLIEAEIDLPVDIAIVPSFTTNRKILDSKFERVDSETQISVAKWKVGSRNILDRRDVNYLISLFRVARGRASRMRFRDRTGYKNPDFATEPEKLFWVRFDSDELTLKVEGEELFSCPSLNLKELIVESIDFTQTQLINTSIFFQERSYTISIPSQLNGAIALRAILKSIVPASNNYPNLIPSGYFTCNGITYTGAQLMSLGNLDRFVTFPLQGVVYVDASGHYVPMTALIFTIEWSGFRFAE